MTTPRAIAATVHLLALAIWSGVLLSTGAAAAILFPTMKQLDPAIPAYAQYTGEHWVLAAGHAAEKLFLLADIIQFLCALLAIITFIALAVSSFSNSKPAQTNTSRLSLLTRGTLLSIALACLAGNLVIVAPSMNKALRAYRAAAQQGLTDDALLHRAAFNELHPVASNLLIITTIATLTALTLGIWNIARSTYPQPNQPHPNNSNNTSPPQATATNPKLEEPALAKAGGLKPAHKHK